MARTLEMRQVRGGAPSQREVSRPWRPDSQGPSSEDASPMSRTTTVQCWYGPVLSPQHPCHLGEMSTCDMMCHGRGLSLAGWGDPEVWLWRNPGFPACAPE